MLDAEEKNIIADLEALVGKLKQLDAAGEDMPEEDIIEEEDNMEEKEMDQEDQEDDVEKQDGPTANDDAEERIEEGLPETTEEAVDEVEKSIKSILSHLRKRSVKKSQDISPKLASAISQLNKIVKSTISNQAKLQKEQAQVSRAVHNILQGLGLADEIEKLNTQVQKQKQPVRYMPNESLEVLKSIEKNLKDIKTEPKDEFNARKSLADVLGHLVVKK